MIEPATGDYERDRQRHLRAFAAGAPAELELLTASRERLRSVQTERLRALLAHARRHSPWHAKRLDGLDVAAVEPDALRDIPPMKKADLMAHWDEIVCDRRLTLDGANAHLERVAAEGPAYLDDEYHVLATGGSTGVRAVMVWDFEGFRLAFGRLLVAGLALASDRGVSPPVTMAMIGATRAIHGSGAVGACFSNTALQHTHSFSAHAPLAELASALESLRPFVLGGYPSVLDRLARLRLEARLAIDPGIVFSTGEPLLPETRARIERAFDAHLRELWGTTEIGLVANSHPGCEGLVISEDLVLLEPVDAAGRPVALGERCAKLLATNLVNRVLPLIRYEITDEAVVLAPEPGCPWQGRRLDSVLGRSDDVFEYPGGHFVHPHGIRSELARVPAIAEYQVRQTAGGIAVDVCAPCELDTAGLERALVGALADSGLDEPEASVCVVERIGRLAASGKLKRFVPLERA